jgi:hypothetical protein
MTTPATNPPQHCDHECVCMGYANRSEMFKDEPCTKPKCKHRPPSITPTNPNKEHWKKKIDRLSGGYIPAAPENPLSKENITMSSLLGYEAGLEEGKRQARADVPGNLAALEELSITQSILYEFCEWFCEHNCEEYPCKIRVDYLHGRLEGIQKQMKEHPEYLVKWEEKRNEQKSLQCSHPQENPSSTGDEMR